MKNIVDSKLCLVCLKQDGFYCIYQEFSNHLTISKQILEITGIEINKAQNIPKKICNECYTNLNIAFNFRRQFKASMDILTEEFSTEEININLLQKTNIESNVKISGNGTNKKNIKTNPDINTGVSSKMRKISPVKKVKSKDKVDKFICEICANQYNKKYKLEKHVRWHKSENSLICEICSKTFSCGSNLKRHIFTHTGERNYQCQYCSKKFAVPKTKDIHERIHTGEKPYTCKLCNKSYTYSYALVNHMRTHTGEKPFRCIPCGKKFGAKSHLHAHNHSLMHKSVLEIYQEENETQQINAQ